MKKSLPDSAKTNKGKWNVIKTKHNKLYQNKKKNGRKSD